MDAWFVSRQVLEILTVLANVDRVVPAAVQRSPPWGLTTRIRVPIVLPGRGGPGSATDRLEAAGGPSGPSVVLFDVNRSKTANRRQFFIEIIFKRIFTQPRCNEFVEFPPRQRPGHRPLRVIFLAPSRDQQEHSVFFQKSRKPADRMWTQFLRQHLQCVNFQDEIEAPRPFLRRSQNIARHIAHRTLRKSPLASPDRRRRDIERRRLESPRRQLLGVVAEPAADHQSRFPRPREFQQVRIRSLIRPRNHLLPLLMLLVKGFEPPSRIARPVELRGQFPRANSIWFRHANNRIY